MEDGTRTPIREMISAALEAKIAGADRFSIADTVGCATPEQISNLVRIIKTKVRIPLEVHCHNDLGLATANSLAAYNAGAEVIDVTVNGLGERAGLASLAEVCIALKILHRENSRKYNMLPRIAKMVEKYSKVRPDKLRPAIGANAFTHIADLHVKAVRKKPECYEIIPPHVLGRKRRI